MNFAGSIVMLVNAPELLNFNLVLGCFGKLVTA